MRHEHHPTELNIEALAAYLTAQPDVLAAYLFGSYARGDARPDSDVDLAVLLSTTDEMERFERRLELIGAVGEALGRRSADVVVLNDAPPLLTHQVLTHGRLIAERDRMARVEFEVRAGKIYFTGWGYRSPVRSLGCRRPGNRARTLQAPRDTRDSGPIWAARCGRRSPASETALGSGLCG